MNKDLLNSIVLFFVLATALPGCASSGPPRDVDDACSILLDRPEWIEAAYDVERKWGAPAPIVLAFIWKESRFRSSAKPPRKHVLGVIPNGRVSSSYGFSQAVDGTWNWYREDSGNRGADRDDFDDSVDFVGWYMAKTKQKTGAAMTNASAQYMAYLLGHGGYRSGKWRNRPDTIRKGREVSERAAAYAVQLKRCDSRFAMIPMPGRPTPM